MGAAILTNAGDKDGFVAKFNSAGVLQWVRQLSGPGDASVLGVVAVDTSDSLYAVGAFGRTNRDVLSFGAGITLTNIGGGLPGIGIGDAFLAEYDASTGTPLWAVGRGGTNVDFFSGVSTDSHGNIYVGGASGGSGAPNGFNAMVAKYDTNGMIQWTQSSTGMNGAFVFAGPGVDARGNCFVAGWYQTNAMFGSNMLTRGAYWNFFVAKSGFAPLRLGIDWSNLRPRLSVFGDTGFRFALEYVSVLAASNN